MVSKVFSYKGPEQLRSVINNVCATLGLRSQREKAPITFIASEENGIYFLKLLYEADIYEWREPASSQGRSNLSQIVLHKLRDLLQIEKSPWGDLVGVRPLKFYRRSMEIMKNEEALAGYLKKEKNLSQEKIDILQQIYTLQEPYMMDALNSKRIAVYGGIPFCTSLCSYCSFPFGLIQKYERVPQFVNTFLKDIECTNTLIKKYQLKIDSAYLGGGTPTSLNIHDFSTILKAFSTMVGTNLEYTVEAGRPDTLSGEKLKIMKECGVNRISLNPQTMQDHILQYVGRNHSVASIDRLFQHIRQETSMDINMDFICGLPKQTYSCIEENMAYVCQNRPENVTIHTLALKKGSPLYKTGMRIELPSPEEVCAMVNYCSKTLRSAGYIPYYLYRQQYMNGSMENIGYTLPHKECRYNIQMMEERMPIVALGPGSTSKWMREPNYRQIKQYLPKNVDTYIDEWERLFLKREEYFDIFYRED